MDLGRLTLTFHITMQGNEFLLSIANVLRTIEKMFLVYFNESDIILLLFETTFENSPYRCGTSIGLIIEQSRIQNFQSKEI